MASISRPVGDKNYFRTPRPTATVRCLSLGLPVFAGLQLQPRVYKASTSRVCQPSRPSRTAAAEKLAPRLAAALRSSARSATSSGSRNGPYSRSVRQRPGTLLTRVGYTCTNQQAPSRARAVCARRVSGRRTLATDWSLPNNQVVSVPIFFSEFESQTGIRISVQNSMTH